MRHCFNEDVSVYQVEGETLAETLRAAASKADEFQNAWFRVATDFQVEDGVYMTTLYAHQ